MKSDNFLSKIILISLLVLYLIVFRNFPYFNLVLQAKVIAGLIFFIINIIFPVKAESLLKSAIILLIASLFLIMLHKPYWAELIGELIYLLLILVFFKKLNDFRKLV